MQKPEKFEKPYRTWCSIPYTMMLETSFQPTSNGGVLDAGQLLWTRQTLPSPSSARVALAFVDGIGTVLIDPRWLTTENASLSR